MSAIDSILGNAHYRYFGYGHKRSEFHFLNKNKSNPLDLVGKITHKGGWSHKLNGQQKPHLSTLDALIFASMLGEKFIRTYYTDINLDNLFLQKFEIKSPPSPIENINIVSLDIMNVDIDLKSNSFNFVTNIHGMKVSISFLSDKNKITSVKNSNACDYITNHLKTYFHHIDNIQFDAPSMVSAQVTRQTLESVSFSGLQCNHDQQISLFEWLIIFSQLGQLAAYNFDKVHRDETHNLWMRSVKAEITTLYNSTQEPVSISGKIDRAKLLNLNEKKWRTFRMSGATSCNSIKFSGKLAHRLPEKIGVNNL